MALASRQQDCKGSLPQVLPLTPQIAQEGLLLRMLVTSWDGILRSFAVGLPLKLQQVGPPAGTHLTR